MANIFAGKESAADVVEEDFIGGGGALDTDIYTARIKTAYVGEAANSKANHVTLLLDVNGREVRQQIWVSNRAGGVTYKSKKAPYEEVNLPGYNQIMSLSMIVAGKYLKDLDVEELKVNIYDYDAKKELPQSVDCFVELHDEVIQIALQRQTVDKTKKNESTGDYEPTGETRDQNEIIKFFPENKLHSISEISDFIKTLGGTIKDVMADGDMAKAISNMPMEKGAYAEKWLDMNKGETYNKSTGKGKSEGKSFGKSKEKEESKAKKTSLFDD